MRKVFILLMMVALVAATPVVAIPTKEEILAQYGIVSMTTTPTIPESCPVCVNMCDVVTATNTIYTVHERVFDLMILDGIDQQMVKRAVSFVPNVFGFVIVPDDPTRYSVNEWNQPQPYDNETPVIILYDVRARNSTWIDGQPFVLGGMGRGQRIWIGLDPSQVSDVQLTRNLFHECTHTLAPPGSYIVTGFPNIDNLPSINSEFWLTHNGITGVYNKLLYTVGWYWKNQNAAWGGVN